MKSSALYPLIALLLALGSISGLSAQARIDKIAEQLEKNENVEKSIVNRRDPKNGKLQRKVHSFSFRDSSITKKLIAAFEAEEPNAYKSAITKNNRSASYAFTFYKNNMELIYSLTYDGHQTALSIIWNPRNARSYQNNCNEMNFEESADYNQIDWNAFRAEMQQFSQDMDAFREAQNEWNRKYNHKKSKK